MNKDEGEGTMVILLDKTRETKNMIRYESGQDVLPMIYIGKTWLGKPIPERVQVTVEKR